MFSCPADHVPGWQPRMLLGMVEARSVNVKNKHTYNARGRGGSGGVEQREQREDTLATQPDRENELSHTKRGVGRVCVSRGHTGFLHLPSAVLALIFIARKIQPSLSLVDREVEFCLTTN